MTMGTGVSRALQEVFLSDNPALNFKPILFSDFLRHLPDCVKKRIVEGRWGAGRGGKSEGKREKKVCVCARERECVCDCKRGKKECALFCSREIFSPSERQTFYSPPAAGGSGVRKCSSMKREKSAGAGC